MTLLKLTDLVPTVRRMYGPSVLYYAHQVVVHHETAHWMSMYPDGVPAHSGSIVDYQNMNSTIHRHLMGMSVSSRYIEELRMVAAQQLTIDDNIEVSLYPEVARVFWKDKHTVRVDVAYHMSNDQKVFQLAERLEAYWRREIEITARTSLEPRVCRCSSCIVKREMVDFQNLGAGNG